VGGSEKSRLLSGSEKKLVVEWCEKWCHIQRHNALFEMTTVRLNTSLESSSPLVNDPPRCARTHAMSQPAAVANRLFLHFTK